MRPSSVSDYQMVADANITYGSSATTYGKIYAGIDGRHPRHNVSHDGIAYGDIYAEGRSAATRRCNGAKRYDSTNIRTIIKSPINFSSFLASLVDISKAGGAGGIVQDTPTVDAWWMTFAGERPGRSSGLHEGERQADRRREADCGAATPLNIPANGAIYSGQPVIVSGIVNGRVTIGCASDIYVGGNITYAQDGDDVLGLVASHSVIVAQWVPTTLSWRAATLAQSGTWRSYGFDAQASPTSRARLRRQLPAHLDDVHRLDRDLRRRLDVAVQLTRLPVRPDARVPPPAVVPDLRGSVHDRALARSRRLGVMSRPWKTGGSSSRRSSGAMQTRSSRRRSACAGRDAARAGGACAS